MFIKKQIGNIPYTFVVEGSNLHKVVKESKKLSFPDVKECGKCASKNLYLNAREAGKKGEFEYTEVKCRDCGAQLQFGQTKADDDVFFLRKRETENGQEKELDWKIYSAEEKTYINE